MAEEEEERADPVPIRRPPRDSDDLEESETETETETDGDESEGDQRARGGAVGVVAGAGASIRNPNQKDEEEEGEKRVGRSPRRLFQRLWTDEEEIQMLRGFLDFTRRRGTTLASHQYDTGPFYDEMRRQLGSSSSSSSFSKSQLIEKLRRLKKKYRNCAARMRSKGPTFTFRSPHEQAVFDLARHIWRPANKPRQPLACSPFQALTSGPAGAGEDELSFSLSFSSPAPAAAPALMTNAKPSPSRRARRRLHPYACAVPPPPPPPEQLPSSAAAEAAFCGAVTAAVPVSVFPAKDVPSAVEKEEDSTVRWGLSSLFKELIGSTIGPGSLGLGPMPVCPPGKSGDERWRRQHILELEVYQQRVELVKEQLMLALHRLKDPASAS